MNDNNRMRALFMRDYYEKFTKIWPRPLLSIPGLEVSNDTFQWIIDSIEFNLDDELSQWAEARYKLHLKQGKNNTWAWYVSCPNYFGIWLSNEKVAKEVFEYYNQTGGYFLQYLPVPEKDKNIVNKHASIEDLIL